MLEAVPERVCVPVPVLVKFRASAPVPPITPLKSKLLLPVVLIYAIVMGLINLAKT